MRRYWLLAALPFALTACGGGNTQSGAPASVDSVDTSPAAAPATTDTMAISDGAVATILMASDSAEIDPSQLAIQKAQNAQVKQFAQRMVKDHGMLEDSLHALAQAQSITPAPSPVADQIRTQEATDMQQLQGLSGAAFDSAYVQMMVEGHQNAQNAVTNQLIPAAQNAQLKTALQQKVVPVVSDHLQMIQQIQSSLGTK
jgi:putative membrane protein